MSAVWPMLRCIYHVHHGTYVLGTYHARHVTHAVGIGCVRRVTYAVGVWYVCHVTHSVGTWYVHRLTYAMGPWVVRHMPYCYAVGRYNVRPGTYVVGFFNVRYLTYVINIHYAFLVTYAVVIWYDLGCGYMVFPPCELCFWVLYDMSAMCPMLNVYIMPTMWLMLWVLSCLPCDLCCGHMIYARYVTHIAGIESISYIYHESNLYYGYHVTLYLSLHQ